jgi:hypothetical protein
MTILKFRESLLQSLLLCAPFEKLNSCPRQQSASNLKRKLGDHKLEEMEGSYLDVRRLCAGCYEKIRQQQPREASNATQRKSKNLLF